MLAKPCSSNVWHSEATTSRSTTRSAGSSSGNPLSGLILVAMLASQSSGHSTCGSGVGIASELEQEGVGRALATDGRLVAVAGEHHDVVGEGQHLLGQAAQHRGMVAARQVGPPD